MGAKTLQIERAVLLLCAGVELDGSFASLIASAHGSSEDVRPAQVTFSPTFSLALAALPDAYWDALTPAGSLRYRQLIHVKSGNSLVLSPLCIDEGILHYLTGVPYLDERLASSLVPSAPLVELAPSQRSLVAHIVQAWSPATRRRIGAERALPVIQVCGGDEVETYAVASYACKELGLRLYRVAASTLPTALHELEGWTRLWEREAIISKRVLLLDCNKVDTNDAARIAGVVRFLQLLRTPLMLMCKEVRQAWRGWARPTVTITVPRPRVDEQRAIWQRAQGEVHLNGQIERLEEVPTLCVAQSASHAGTSVLVLLPHVHFEGHGSDQRFVVRKGLHRWLHVHIRWNDPGS